MPSSDAFVNKAERILTRELQSSQWGSPNARRIGNKRRDIAKELEALSSFWASWGRARWRDCEDMGSAQRVGREDSLLSTQVQLGRGGGDMALQQGLSHLKNMVCVRACVQGCVGARVHVRGYWGDVYEGVGVLYTRGL